MIINKKLISLSLSSIICASLTGCGGSDGDSSTDFIGSSGYEINASNVDSVVQSGVIDSLRLTSDLLSIGNEIDISSLEIDYIDDGDNTISYLCDMDGTIAVTDITVPTTTHSSLDISYDNCEHKNVYYHGDISLETDMATGGLAEFGSYSNDWSATQNKTLTNLVRTESGVTNIINGDVTLQSSNTVDDAVFQDRLTGNEISYDFTDADGNTSSYDFSNLSYQVVENYDDDIYQLALDFTTNHSLLGEIELATDPILSIESDLLESGTVTLTTGTSTMQLYGTGNDVVEMSLDINNDGVYEVPLPSTTFSTLFD